MDIAAQTQPAAGETAIVRDKTDVISYDDQGCIVPGKTLTCDEEQLTLPDCQMISRLGRGGMGAVFLAKQKRLDRLVAVKMLNKAVAANPEFVEKLLREAVTLAALNHPNVVGCHDIMTTDQGVFLIMEYIPGQLTVRDLVLRLGNLPEPVVARIMLDVVKGLSYIHAKGFTHRDLKPDNLMLFWDKPQPPRTFAEIFADTQTRVTICDFGISQHKRSGQRAEGIARGGGTEHAMATACWAARPTWRQSKSMPGKTSTSEPTSTRWLPRRTSSSPNHRHFWKKIARS